MSGGKSDLCYGISFLSFPERVSSPMLKQPCEQDKRSTTNLGITHETLDKENTSNHNAYQQHNIEKYSSLSPHSFCTNSIVHYNLVVLSYSTVKILPYATVLNKENQLCRNFEWNTREKSTHKPLKKAQK